MMSPLLFVARSEKADWIPLGPVRRRLYDALRAQQFSLPNVEPFTRKLWGGATCRRPRCCGKDLTIDGGRQRRGACRRNWAKTIVPPQKRGRGAGPQRALREGRALTGPRIASAIRRLLDGTEAPGRREGAAAELGLSDVPDAREALLTAASDDEAPATVQRAAARALGDLHYRLGTLLEVPLWALTAAASHEFDEHVGNLQRSQGRSADAGRR